MKKGLRVCAVALGLGLSAPVMADDRVIGAVIGGTAGGAVGYQLGGEDGAAIGALVGAVVGAELADDHGHRPHRHPRHYDAYPYHRHLDYAPPPHAAVWGHRPPVRVIYVDHGRSGYHADRRHRDHWRDHRHRHGRYCDH
ncbi:hypothetical protein ABSH63_13580 [Sinimarinibacterium sp. HSW-8]|uniref:YMGG-like Gly-zipper domain-containing protein n=2 Tax=Sinimarinibacterium thermocellulolyticum TaxID=3170016 RepID=A0ABV2ACR5_9GAMM